MQSICRLIDSGTWSQVSRQGPAGAAVTDVWTFASLIEGHMQVTAHCEDRHFTNEVDLVSLRDWLGPEHPATAADLKKLLHCPKCRGKRTSSSKAKVRKTPERVSIDTYAVAR